MPAGVLVVHNAEARETLRECVAIRDVLDVQVAVVIRGVRCIGGERGRRDAVEVDEAEVGGDEQDVLDLRRVRPRAGGVAGGVQLVEQCGHWIVCWRVGHGCVRAVRLYESADACEASDASAAGEGREMERKI